MVEPALDHGTAAPDPAPRLPLVVDLDGTLVRTDMLFETLWATLSRRPARALAIARATPSGRAAVKRVLADGAIDAARLPWTDDVLALVREWRAAGGLTLLVSASDQAVVDAVAAHLDLFDEAHGSDGADNLKGPAKARWLTDRFDPGGFAYVGDSRADLAVWRVAGQAVTVGAAPAIRAEVDALDIPTRHIAPPAGRLRPLVRALRPHQWLKNVLVFLPVLAAHQLDLVTLLQAALAFAAFSLTASSVYLLNDLLDLDADRAHPRKRARPFAAGTLPLAWGTVLAPGLLLAGLALAAALGPAFLWVMILYYVITTAYSFDLKRRLIVDICTLAGLYTLRIVAGGAATGIPLSVWLLAFSIFFFFALAALKRQAELVAGAAEGAERAHGRGYWVEDLPLVAMMSVASGYVSVLVMALYLNSGTVQQLYAWPAPLWGICLILLYWISRVVMITYRGWMHDDPVVFAARDRISLICAAAILVLAVAGIVLPGPGAAP